MTAQIALDIVFARIAARDTLRRMDYGSQTEIVDFLASRDGGAVRVAMTHISIVVVCATRAYKLKRAVALPYLDFSTVQKRLDMCGREVALNRRTAPALYLGVRRVTREADGSLAFDGAGETLDAVVEMRRFDEGALFSSLAARGELTSDLVETLARKIAAFHDAAAPDFSHGGGAAMARVVAMNAQSLYAARPARVEEIAALVGRFAQALAEHDARLDSRRAAGKTRHCHGDLTLANICLFEGAPTLFDCLEFADDLATVDVLYDLAFLLMDLARAGRGDLANLALNRYLDARDETDGLPLLPFFMSLRAAIRAHVAATQGKPEEARGYFDLAMRLTTPRAPIVVAIGGFSGSGKSTLARRLAATMGAAPGARAINSDRLRKAMFGVAPTTRLPQEAYASAVSQRVYAAMFDAARRTAACGWPVIVDAVFDRQEDRVAVEAAARETGAPFHGFWLDAPVETRASRVDLRVGDPSDATRAVATAQQARDPGALAWARIDAARGADDSFAAVLARLGI